MSISRIHPGTDAVNDLATIGHHEAAHAVAALHLGARVHRIRLWQVSPTCWEGRVDMDFPDTDQGNRAAAVALLAGVAAERAWLDLHAIPTHRHPHDVHASGRRDRDLVADCLTRITRATRPGYREIERDAALLVTRCWDRIEHLAARLAAPYQPNH